MSQDHPIIAVLATSETAWLGRWRTLADHDACEADGCLWVRGPAHEGWLRLPARARYTADAAGRLTPAGRRVPTARLPAGPWQPLAEFLRVRPPAAALPGLHAAPVAWSLVPSDEFHPAEMMVLPLRDFARWGLGAPAVRLMPLHFAASGDGRICVIGRPLPSIPGEMWCVQGHIATPAGWALPKGITPALVAESMKLVTSEFALIHTDGSAERLPAEAFVAASRSAIRATASGAQTPFTLED